MATVLITITDRPGGFTCVAESDPPMPLLDGGAPDVDNMTDAQAAGVWAATQLYDAAEGRAEWRVLLKDSLT